jgi:ATP-binding cassette subfamily B protein
METYFKDKIANNYLEVTNNNLLLSKKVNTSELLKNIFENIMLVLIIYLGIKNVMDKSMTIGSLVTYNSIIYYFLAPIRSSLDLYREFIYAKNSLNRINHLLDYKSESVDKPKRLSTLGGIYVKNLSFSYDKREDILKDITIDIKPKAKVLLLGGSGSGKSTLLKLLYKYYEIDRDKIFISGYDLNDFNVSDIRKNIAYISQNEFLYTDTIRNNIILDRNIQESEFLTICKLTRVDSIIKEKNISYDYPLEENGANLSGGERSRIILARMLLKKANIIMIDEGLNAIDVKLARNILKDLFQKYPECLFIIVTHRTDNMDLFSQIIKIDKGHLVEGLNKYV